MLKQLLVIIVCLFVLCVPFRTYAAGATVINEALVHPSTGNKEWVEFYTQGDDLTNYWIDDDTDFANDSGGSSKKQITSAVQGSDVHHVLFELTSSMFNNDGDTIALFSPDGQLIDQYQYTNDPGVDISIGRTPDATGNFTVLANATRGSANSVSKPTETPTPEPTAKPTHSASSGQAKEPKVTKTPTVSKDASSTLSDSSVGVTGSDWVGDGSEEGYDNKMGSLAARPTSILGIATKAAEKKSKPTPTVMVKGSSTSTMPMVLLSFGGLFLLSCGILIYLKKRGIWN